MKRALILVDIQNDFVPGGALAVDREVFARRVESRLEAHPNIRVRREEVTAIPLDRPVIVACGPLPGEALLADIDRLVGGRGRLHYFDGGSPIVAADLCLLNI